MGFCNSANRDTFQGLNEAKATGGGESLQREHEEDGKEKEERLRKQVPCEHQGGIAMGHNPEKKDGDSEGNGGCKGEVVGALMVRMYCIRSRRILYKCWNVLYPDVLSKTCLQGLEARARAGAQS